MSDTTKERDFLKKNKNNTICLVCGRSKDQDIKKCLDKFEKLNEFIPCTLDRLNNE